MFAKPVTRNLQVVILLQLLSCIYSHTLVYKLCCGRTTWRSDPDPEALWWKQVNQHHKGRLVPASGCSRSPMGLRAIPWGAAPTTLDMPRTGWSTNAFCPTGSSSGLCWALFGVCRCLHHSCNSLVSGEVATNPFIKERCVFHFKCSLGCREQASVCPLTGACG